MSITYGEPARVASPLPADEPNNCRIALVYQHAVDDLEIKRIIQFGDNPLCTQHEANEWADMWNTGKGRAADRTYAIILPGGCDYIRGPKGGAH